MYGSLWETAIFLKNVEGLIQQMQNVSCKSLNIYLHTLLVILEFHLHTHKTYDIEISKDFLSYLELWVNNPN